MRLMILVFAVLLLAGSVNAADKKWGYLVDEDDLPTYQAMGNPTPKQVSSYAVANHKSMGGAVHEVGNAIAQCTQVDNRTWQTNNTTKWRYWNNMQWWTTPYPAQIPFKAPEMELERITIWKASGDFYLVAASVPA